MKTFILHPSAFILAFSAFILHPSSLFSATPESVQQAYDAALAAYESADDEELPAILDIGRATNEFNGLEFQGVVFITPLNDERNAAYDNLTDDGLTADEALALLSAGDAKANDASCHLGLAESSLGIGHSKLGLASMYQTYALVAAFVCSGIGSGWEYPESLANDAKRIADEAKSYFEMAQQEAQQAKGLYQEARGLYRGLQ